MSASALVIIDMQREMQVRLDAGRDCVNPGAGAAIARLVAACRAAEVPVVHVRHRQDDPARPFHPEAPGFAPMPCAEAAPGEAVFVKVTSSAFASTGLEAHLRGLGIGRLFVVGAVAGFCVNSTVRAAADLGFAVTVVRDAVLGFDLPGKMDAQTLFDATMALLEPDFAQLVESEVLCAQIGG
ncbi:MAG: cysteine hydrolase [Rhodobacter sp.]|nr:cysteine hydrolase [Paracoccaceae bacterium]MCC0076093.1 cysteine hydrolase [Rhodobacter sp.]